MKEIILGHPVRQTAWAVDTPPTPCCGCFSGEQEEIPKQISQEQVRLTAKEKRQQGCHKELKFGRKAEILVCVDFFLFTLSSKYVSSIQISK